MLLCVSASHHTASFDLLENLSGGAAPVLSQLGARGDIGGAIVLSTCNRFEVYLDGDDVDAVDAVAGAVGVDAGVLRTSTVTLQGDDVARHLFSVAAGLESVVIGEDEISGQVSRALLTARKHGTTSPTLERLFQRATKTSRGVKTQTALGSSGRSLVRLALELASSLFADWSTQRVLLVGTGQYAATTVTALRDRAAADIRVFSPSGRAAPFATKYGLRAEFDLRAALADADIVITCTTSAHPVVTSAVLADAHRRLIIDLGLPRNVDPDVAGIAGVELLDLETISLHAPLEELTSTADARAIVTDAASEFAADAQVAPTVTALRQHVLGVLADELGRRGVTPEAEAAMRHFAGVLLHTPSSRARDLAREGRGAEFVLGVDALFGVQAAEDAQPATTAEGQSA